MKRREWIKNTGAMMGAGLLAPSLTTAKERFRDKKPDLKIAHITDVHITPEAKDRFVQCLEEIKKEHKIDFFLNGGDSIMAADYEDITQDRVITLWKAWDEAITSISDFEIHSCLGNHDMWWAAPDKSDTMYGKDYVVKKLKIPHRYYSINKKGWHFIMLDGNNKNISLDDEQYEWLENDLNKLPSRTPTILMSHYPVLGVSPHFEGGMHTDFAKLKDLFYQHKDKVKAVLSGHNHLDDYAVYNGVQYCCNGSMSGFWWGEGDEKSAGKYYYKETPPGYAILSLYKDGSVINEYIPHHY